MYLHPHWKASLEASMLALCAWTGLFATRVKHVPCFDALTGTYLGELLVPRVVRDVHNLLRDLQSQAAKLLPHAWRDFEDTMLFFGKQGQYVCLTPSGFAYKQDLTQVETNQALFFLAGPERVNLSWDENDEYATQVLKEYELFNLVENSRYY